MTEQEQAEVSMAIEIITEAFLDTIDTYVTDPDLNQKIKEVAGLRIITRSLEAAKAQLEEAIKATKSGPEPVLDEAAMAELRKYLSKGLSDWPDERF